MFSATGSLLPGSSKRPDFFIHMQPDGEYRTETCMFNKLGYIPIISTFTGLCRLLLGIVHTIVHLVSAIFDKLHRSEHIEEVGIGVLNIARGYGEAIPIIGNLAMFIRDKIIIHGVIQDIRSGRINLNA